MRIACAQVVLGETTECRGTLIQAVGSGPLIIGLRGVIDNAKEMT